METTQAFDICWDKVYILACYDRLTGQSYLTTYSGSYPMVDVVITGINEINMPYWNATVPPHAEIHAVPAGKAPKDYAKELGGIQAYGWYIEDKIERG